MAGAEILDVKFTNFIGEILLKHLFNKCRLILLVLGLILIGCIGSEPTATPYIIMATPTTTSQPTSYPTLQPTPPSTATVEPTIPPTPTPISYQLANWTPQQVNDLIAQLQDYAQETKPSIWSGNPSWFHLPALVQVTAGRQFPTDPSLTQWQLGAAYNLGLFKSEQTTTYYALLLAEALNNKQATPETLPAWLTNQDNRLLLQMIELDPLPDGAFNALLLLNGMGGAYWWLVEIGNSFQVFPLVEQLTFGFSEPILTTIELGLGDLIDNGAKEILSLTRPILCDGLCDQSELIVFDLSQTPPRSLSFYPPLPKQGMTGWEYDSQARLTILQMVDVLDCQLPLKRHYEWNGLYFNLAEITYPDFSDNQENSASCQTILVNMARQDSRYQVRSAMVYLESILSKWPFRLIDPVSMEPYPADARDQLRFELGLYRALVGDFEQAVAHFQVIVNTPTIADSEWIIPAGKILAIYQTPDRLWSVCASQLCYPILPLEQLVGLAPAGQLPVTTLQQIGLPIATFGNLDIDQDGLDEYWFVSQSIIDDNYDVWLLAQGPVGWHRLNLTTITNSEGATTDLLHASLFYFAVADGGVFGILGRDSAGFPYLTRFSSYAKHTLQTAQADLWLNRPTAEWLNYLQSVQTSPYFVCDLDPEQNLCPDFLFLLGLAYELNGNNSQAVFTYLQLWESYPNSPYNLIVRKKLDPEPTLP